MRQLSDYTIILILTILVTLPLEFLSKKGVYRQLPRTAKSTYLPFLVFILFDVIFAETNLWAFSSKHTYSFRFFGLPAEEIMFFIIVPLAGLLTYSAVSSLRARKSNNSGWTKWIIFMAGYFLIGILVYQFRKASLSLNEPQRIAPYYSLYVLFIIMCFVFWVRQDKNKILYLKSNNFFYSIVICLSFMIPFNGYLTKLTDPIVTYRANLGPRIYFDMPFEDVFYGLVLLSWILIRFNVTNKKEV